MRPGRVVRHQHPAYQVPDATGSCPMYWYTHDDLFDAIQDRCARPMLDNLNPNNPTHRHWMDVIRSPVFTSLMPDQEFQSFVDEWMMIFDHIYFDNLVRCKTGPPIISHSRTGALAHYNPNERELTIDIDCLYRTASFETGSVPVNHRVVSVLLHEMVHAFVDLYGCRCRDCFQRKPELDGVGIGHGPPFLTCLGYLHGHLQQAVLFEVRLGIKRSLEGEMEQGWRADATHPEHVRVWLSYPD